MSNTGYKGISSPTGAQRGGRHICTLDTEDANAFRPYDHAIKHSLTISSRNPNTRYYFRSLTLIEKERQRHLSITQSLIIHPLSVFRIYWELFHLFALYAGLAIAPINFIFGPLQANKQISFGFTPCFATLEIILDVIYLLDFGMTFFTGFSRNRQSVILLQFRLIAKKYMSTLEFYSDLLCCISTMGIALLYCTFVAPDFNMIESGMAYLKLIGIIKILRIMRFLKYLKSVSEMLHHYYYLRVLIRYIALIAIGLHWLTCIYIMLVQTRYVYKSYADYEIYSFEYEDLLLNDYSFMYLYAQLFIVTYLLGISFTSSFKSIFDNRIQDYYELWTCIVYSSIGFIVNNLLTILILQLFLSINATEAKYHSIMSQLFSFMRLKMLPKSMKKRFVCYYEYRFQKNYFREATIMGMLSETLRHDINLHSCRSLIQSVSILRDLPLDIISEVVFHLNHEVYLYNDVIVKAGTVGDCMYFIANGTVAVLTPTGREICHLQDGSYFGEIALISENQRRIAHVVAIEICEVYRLKRAHFDGCFQKNTMFYKKIQQTARERREKTVLLEELHKKYLYDRCLNSQTPITTY